VTLCAKRIDDFARHIAFVVFGQHGVGDECTGRLNRTLGYDALSLAEQVRQDSAKGDRNCRIAIRDLKLNL